MGVGEGGGGGGEGEGEKGGGWRIKKNIRILSSAELAQRVVKVKQMFSTRFKQNVRQIFLQYIERNVLPHCV